MVPEKNNRKVLTMATVKVAYLASCPIQVIPCEQNSLNDPPIKASVEAESFRLFTPAANAHALKNQKSVQKAPKLRSF